MSGTVAINIPASDELTQRSPRAMRKNGPTSSAKANAQTAPLCRRSSASAPLFQATGNRTKAPSAIRAHATPIGGDLRERQFDEEVRQAPDDA